MKPNLTVEFTAKTADGNFKEESVPLHSPDELFAFVAPGGGCDSIPTEVSEIQMVFLPPSNPNAQNPVADVHTTLQIGMVLFNGPLSEISQVAEQIIDKAGRGELSQSFLGVMGVCT